MNRTWWWFADFLSRALEKSEREAVHGDLAETHESGPRALRHVVGLVARRQGETWSDWRAWLTLGLVLFPIGVLLSITSHTIVSLSSVYGWLYFHNWYSQLLQNRGFWYVLEESLRSLFGGYLRVVCLSWSIGFLLGRKVRCLQAALLGILLCVVLALGVLKAAPAYWTFEQREIQQWLHLARVPAQQKPVAASMVYETILPLVIAAMFVAVPALLGLRHAGSMRPAIARFAVPAASLTLAITVLQVSAMIFITMALLKLGVPPGRWYGGPPFVHAAIDLLIAITYWPLAYLLMEIVKRLREQLVSFGRSERLETSGGKF